MALPHSTLLYITLPWFYLTLLQSTIALLHATGLHAHYSTMALLDLTLLYDHLFYFLEM